MRSVTWGHHMQSEVCTANASQLPAGMVLCALLLHRVEPGCAPIQRMRDMGSVVQSQS
jgi:hypothetical protein